MNTLAPLSLAGLLASIALATAGSSPAYAADPCITPVAKVPTMTIKIFNDDPAKKNNIYAVLTTGKGKLDIWLQAIFKTPNGQVARCMFPRAKNYRLFLNPNGAGIPPGKSITLTLPLFTQLVTTPDATKPDQYIDWWNGGTIQLYYSPTAKPPKALVEALTRPSQREVTRFAAGAVKPTCVGCQPLKIYSDTSDLPKNDPSQLLEYTLGARIDLGAVPDNKPPNALDLKNVDFDVSYVNLAALPAAMGPYQNDQVGYVGTPAGIDAFRTNLNKFLADYPKWPRFVRKYKDNTQEILLKLPSPLEIFARLTGVNPPPDLTPPPQWPTKLWDPIEDLRSNWIKYAGSVAGARAAGLCSATASKDTFCDAIVEAKKIMIANYNKYRSLFPNTCKGTPIDLTDAAMISHVYGWTPFTEAKTGTGCGPRDNLLQDTPGYSDNHNKEYLRVKLLFDKLNYGTLTAQKYVFNPWVLLIHNKKYLNTPNAYAYSVDDAVGNIQALGTGIIIDVGSTAHLENRLPAAPPITINFGLNNGNVKFTNFRICKNTPDRDQPVNPFFTSFIINANNPITCPVFFYDNKNPKQLYTFKIVKKPPFTFFQDQSQGKWTPQTAAAIDCTGNGAAPYQPSSKTWCCDESASNGVWAMSVPEPDSAHKTQNHLVIAHGPEPTTTTRDSPCNRGQVSGTRSVESVRDALR